MVKVAPWLSSIFSINWKKLFVILSRPRNPLIESKHKTKILWKDFLSLNKFCLLNGSRDFPLITLFLNDNKAFKLFCNLLTSYHLGLTGEVFLFLFLHKVEVFLIC